jgi:hypothetical protein
MGNVNTDGLRGVPNSHRHIEAPLLGETALTSCPLCGQLLPNGDEAARIHAKLDADERARQRQWDADKLQIAAASRNEGKAEVEAATQQRFTILLNENAQLKENMQTTVDEQVNKRVADREAKFNVERALHSQEIIKLKAEVAKVRSHRRPAQFAAAGRDDRNGDLQRSQECPAGGQHQAGAQGQGGG